MMPFNGLSLRQADITNPNIKLLALNDTIIPGQVALHYEETDKWGVSKIWVCFEVMTKPVEKKGG
jgi:hypothetical protein